MAFFEAQSPGPPIPLSTLQLTPRDARCKTRGQDGFAFSFLVGLFHSRQHAGSSRRTPDSAAQKAAHRVRLPAGRFGEIPQGNAAGLLEQVEDLGRLAAAAGGRSRRIHTSELAAGLAFRGRALAVPFATRAFVAGIEVAFLIFCLEVVMFSVFLWRQSPRHDIHHSFS